MSNKFTGYFKQTFHEKVFKSPQAFPWSEVKGKHQNTLCGSSINRLPNSKEYTTSKEGYKLLK